MNSLWTDWENRQKLQIIITIVIKDGKSLFNHDLIDIFFNFFFLIMVIRFIRKLLKYDNIMIKFC